MRRPSHDASLPRWAIQVFGVSLVAAMAIYGMATGSKEILLALIPVAIACIGLSAFDRVTREVQKAMAPSNDSDEPSS